MFNLGCHLIDVLVIVLGKPEKVTAYVRRTRPQQDNLADNQLAVFEYPKATATVRSSVMEVDGGKRRQFVVCGDKGTVDIKPLEPPCSFLEKIPSTFWTVRLPRRCVYGPAPPQRITHL
jgi:predicted dehydrogenase